MATTLDFKELAKYESIWRNNLMLTKAQIEQLVLVTKLLTKRAKENFDSLSNVTLTWPQDFGDSPDETCFWEFAHTFQPYIHISLLRDQNSFSIIFN